jgi:hypothetical protein
MPLGRLSDSRQLLKGLTVGAERWREDAAFGHADECRPLERLVRRELPFSFFYL